MVSKLHTTQRVSLHIICSVLIVGLFTTNINAQYLDQQSDKTFNSPIIIIDPGHGGKDKGCHGTHYNEKEICLDLSRKISQQLQKMAPEVQVVLTRASDKFISLDKRVNIANSWSADLFISIHANSIDLKTVRGSETFVYGPHLSHHQKMVAQRENATLFIENEFPTDDTVESLILQTSSKTDILKKSIELAEILEASLAEIDSHKSRGVKQSNFAVLKNISIPSVLLEAGYLTNTRDLKTLQSREGQELIAIKIAQGIIKYLKNHPRNTPN